MITHRPDAGEVMCVVCISWTAVWDISWRWLLSEKDDVTGCGWEIVQYCLKAG